MVSALLGKFSFFTEEAISWMNGICPRMACNLQDLFGAQITFRGDSAAYAVGFIGFDHMPR